MTTNSLLGIFGGMFDPIHLGHLRIATELAEHCAIDSVHFIPAFQPVHRQPTLADSQTRFTMLKSAIANNPLFVADDRELQRQSQSYTIDTLLELRQDFPNKTLCVFLGSDAFAEFHTWHRYLEILQLAHLIVANRPSAPLPTNGLVFELMQQHQTQNIEYIHKHTSGGIYMAPCTLLDISSTDIRKQIAMGRDPRYLLPEGVYEYIKLNGTYQK